MTARENLPEDVIVYDPKELDAAIIGIGRRCGFEDAVAYDRDLLVKVFMDMNGWDREEAEEWISFNIEGGHLGDKTPIIVDRIEP